MILFTAAEVARVTGGSLEAGDPGAHITGVVTDSREAGPGDLFVAIGGSRHDGHDFLPAAAGAGAVAALVARVPAPAPGLALIRTADPVVAMGALAAHHRRRFALPVVAVTGSVGKTAVKDLTAGVLAQGYRVLATSGNLNTEIGVPLTLFGLDRGHGVAVLEMGMRGEGQIAYLAAMALPLVGVVTNVGDIHLEALGSREAIARAKGELLAALPAGGVAVVNAADPGARRLGERHRGAVIAYGDGPRAVVTARSVRSHGAAGTSWTLAVEAAGWPEEPLGGKSPAWPPGPAGQEVRLPLAGRHNVSNALGAAAVGLLFGLTPAAVARGLALAPRSDMRLAVRRVAGVVILDDTYNAGPASTLAALEVLRDLAGAGRAVAVLGNMLELGSQAEAGHRRVGKACAGLAGLVTLGDLAAGIARAARAAGLDRVVECYQRDEALAALEAMVRKGDTILFKGSRGMRMELLLADFVAARGRGGRR
ncbi:MAG: UDP-N-acetylmuramoyl-tripeptide--D-alanyl-D-alanine ligase [bacterium]|nr:UDP-N-acetylmuramoyl-tripeptide--D-alanyl-D-alanine ligase [bacterium]